MLRASGDSPRVSLSAAVMPWRGCMSLPGSHACKSRASRTGDADVEQRVEAAGAHEGRVQQVRPVGGADDEQVAGACGAGSR